MLIRFAEIYDNTEILSPIDRETWEAIGETCKIGPESRVLELASGKGAFALYLTRKFGCQVDCFDSDPDFSHYASERAVELSMARRVRFSHDNVKHLNVEREAYDLGVCLGALYLFREEGWRVLMRGVQKNGYIAVSDLFCKKSPPPKDVKDVFFEEEEGGPLTLEDTRRWYMDRGMEIHREVECSRRAWLEYYDLTRSMLLALGKKYAADTERQAEIKEALKEDSLVRQHGEEYLGYMTFIMRKT